MKEKYHGEKLIAKEKRDRECGEIKKTNEGSMKLQKNKGRGRKIQKNYNNSSF